MKIVIDIPEVYFEVLKKKTNEFVSGQRSGKTFMSVICGAVAKGTPLPEGHGRLIDADKFLEKVKKDREHEAYMHSWTADNVLERLDSWYAPTIVEADNTESEEARNNES